MSQLNEKIKASSSTELTFDWLFESSSIPETESEDELMANTLKTVYQDPNYQHVRALVLPYTSLKSRFHHKDSLKISEIDAIFRVCPRSPMSPYFPSLLAYTTSILVNAIDIGGGPGAYTEYYQFRYVNSMTIGFTKRSEPWDFQIVNPHHLIRFYGQDNSGDLISQWKDFIQMTTQQFMVGVDYISATTKMEKDYDYQALIQLYLILRLIKDGANAIIRIEATWSLFMKQVIYFAALCFEEVHLFQPLVSGADSDELFLILKQSKSTRKNYYIVLENLFKDIPNISSLHGFLKSELPESYLNQIAQIKSKFFHDKANTLFQIQKHLKNQPIEKQENIDIKLKLLEWSLPDPY